MKILHVITGLSRSAGGPARSVQGLVAAECAAGIDAWVWAINGGEPWVEGVRRYEVGVDGRCRCTAELKSFDLVHIHGIWSRKLHKVAVMCRKAGVPYVIAPRGMLEPWSLKQKWLKKRIARFLYQDRDLRLAAALHATAESEAEQFRRLGFKNNIIISPNGVNVPEGEISAVGSRSRTAELANSSIVGRRALAEKEPDCLTRKERECIVSRIERTENVLVRYPQDPELLSFIKGYWDGDAKTTRAIVDWGHMIVPESVINGDIGEIQTHKNSIRSILFHTKFRGPLKVLVLERLADILQNAILYNKGRDGDDVFYNLAHRLQFDPGDGAAIKEFIARLIVKETPDGNRTWTVEFSNKKELTGMPTTGEAATVEVTRLKSPSTHTILKKIYAVNGAPRRALFVSRMHPKKGVLELVEAWARVKKSGKSVVSNRITENWFDVEDPDIIRGLPTIRVLVVESALADRRAIKDVFRGFGLVENAADGRKVAFPSKSAGKMLGQRGVDLYRLAGSFAELFNKSRRAWSETEAEIDDHKVHRNIGAYHQYIAKFNDGNDDCYIRFTVREERGTKNSRNEVHSSTVSRVTVYKAKGAELSNLGHAQAEDSTPFVDNKIAYFFTRVNPTWQCELVYTMNSEEERAYEQKVKDRILALGMSYQDKDGTIHSTTTTSACDFILTGPLDDDAKWNAYARADLFVLPTYSENFGIVVAEALWAGVPVITTKGTPWAELECSASSQFQVPSSKLEERCGWWIELPGKKVKVRGEGEQWNALDSALKEALSLHCTTTTSDYDSLPQMGQRGHQLVSNRYTWSAVVGAMKHGYEQALNTCEFAPCDTCRNYGDTCAIR